MDNVPAVMPSLAHRTCPQVDHILFNFPEEVIRSSKRLRRCTYLMNTIDHIVQTNAMHHNTCLILQAGAQATMRLIYYVNLPRNWNSLVEVPFCLSLSKTGRCPRALDAEHLELTEQWLTLLVEVLEPLKNIPSTQLDIIAPPHIASKSFKEGHLNHQFFTANCFTIGRVYIVSSGMASLQKFAGHAVSGYRLGIDNHLRVTRECLQSGYLARDVHAYYFQHCGPELGHSIKSAKTIRKHSMTPASRTFTT